MSERSFEYKQTKEARLLGCYYGGRLVGEIRVDDVGRWYSRTLLGEIAKWSSPACSSLLQAKEGLEEDVLRILICRVEEGLAQTG